MSITSEEACSTNCPRAKWQGECDGNACPRWVVERLSNDAIACYRRDKGDGRFWDILNEDDIADCQDDNDVPNCISCPKAYGHCAG